MSTNVPHLLALEPDVAVVGEATVGVPELPSGVSWQSKAPYPGAPKGLGVLARHPWAASTHPLASTSSGWLLPVTITGPVNFTLLAMHTVAMPGWPSYTGQVEQVIAEVLPQVEGDVVLAGDLNAPISSTMTSHFRNDQRLGEGGLVSAYLASRSLDVAAAYADDAEAGALQEPTFFMHRRADRPFHIDHVYLPSRWTASSTLQVGSHDEWVATGRSDHVPVIVDVDRADGASSPGPS